MRKNDRRHENASNGRQTVGLSVGCREKPRRKPLFFLVGVAGFEPATPSVPNGVASHK
jgi:hypothetical protein